MQLSSYIDVVYLLPNIQIMLYNAEHGVTAAIYSLLRREKANVRFLKKNARLFDESQGPPIIFTIKTVNLTIFDNTILHDMIIRFSLFVIECTCMMQFSFNEGSRCDIPHTQRLFLHVNSLLTYSIIEPGAVRIICTI